MADSIEVLATLKVVYTIYAFIAISIIAWFAYGLTKPANESGGAKAGLFWSYVVILAIIGMGLHFVTYKAIPWVSIDMKRANIKPDKVFDIVFENHKMTFSEFPMHVKCNEHVTFNAISKDLTYGFGIFRSNHTMVAQMQVVPQSRNDLMWKFGKNGTYYIRSTEYSGPKGAQMVEKNALVVSGCDENDEHTSSMGGL